MLCGCNAGEKPMQNALNVRAEVLQTGGCSFTMDTTLYYENDIYRFLMAAQCRKDGSCEMQILKPASIAGIKASIDKNGGHLSYGDSVLGFEAFAGGKLAPMQLPQLFCTALCSDYISAANAEGEYLRATYLHGYDEDEITVDVWFSDQTGYPEKIEVSFAGDLLMSAAISDFEMNKGQS